MDEMMLVYTTWPDAETAQAAGIAAVEAGLAACANILGPIQSIYRWEGEMQQQTELAMLLKTRAALAEPLKAMILARHPYSTPCVIGLPVSREGSNAGFLSWIEEQTMSDARQMPAGPDN